MLEAVKAGQAVSVVPEAMVEREGLRGHERLGADRRAEMDRRVQRALKELADNAGSRAGREMCSLCH